MQHSNCYSNVKNIDHSITSLNTGLFSGKSGSRLQIALFFLFYRNFQPSLSLKKRLCHRCFPANFAKFLRTPFFTKHLRWLRLFIRTEHLLLLIMTHFSNYKGLANLALRYSFYKKILFTIILVVSILISFKINND